MRNTDERIIAVKERAKEMERQKQMRRSRITGISSAVASLILVIVLSFAMPGLILTSSGGEYAYSGTAAGIFDRVGDFGYLLIGLIAFGLGVSVTILCYRIHLRSQPSREDRGDSDDRTD